MTNNILSKTYNMNNPYIYSFLLAICIFAIFFSLGKIQVILFMNTILGKVLLITLLILICNHSIYYGGVFLCLIILFYKLYGFDSYSIYKHDFLDGVDQIYWINLDRSPERRERMLKMFQDDSFKQLQGGNKIKRIKAVDGKQDEVLKQLNTNEIHNTKLEYACLLSHLQAIKEFSESNHQTALIMEDDATLEFKPYWNKTIREIIRRAPYNWEMIQLCYNTTRKLKKDFTLNTNYGKATQYGNIACLTAYIIHKDAAKKFIQEHYDNASQQYKLRNYHTHEADHYLFKCLRTYAYKYPMFIYPTENNSTLHPSDLQSHILSKNRIIQMYKEMNI